MVKFKTSSSMGIDDEAPGLETVSAEAIEDKRSASSGSLPVAILAIKKPANVSPAAVVSTAFTR